MAQKWSLQDIKAATPRRPVQKHSATERPHQDIARPQPKPTQTYVEDPDLASIDVIDGNKEKKKRIFITTTIGVLILAIGLGISSLLGGAELHVQQKNKEVSVQATYTASKTPQPKQLTYELLTLKAQAAKQVQAKGKEQVSERAQGKIFVYNTKSTAPQRLIKNTRFESPEGYIYRITESIEIPGAVKKADGTFEPGTTVADVFADSTGEKYNIPPSRFTVPGLKDSDQYENVYAESQSQFTGGFEGEKYIIDETELDTAEQQLSLELRNTLLAELAEKKPAGFVIFDDAVTFTYEQLPATEFGDSLATVEMQAHLHTPLFKLESLSTFVALQSIPEYKNEPVLITNPEALVFSYSSSTVALSDISQMSEIEFMLKGDVNLVWQFNEDALKNDIIGKKKSDAATIFSQYPAISNAEARIRPFWETSFPDDPNEISIIKQAQ